MIGKGRGRKGIGEGRDKRMRVTQALGGGLRGGLVLTDRCSSSTPSPSSPGSQLYVERERGSGGGWREVEEEEEYVCISI